jgi:hypothetical protein
MSKQSRQSAALQLEKHLKRGTKPVSKTNLVERDYTDVEIVSMKSQITLLNRRINGESISKTKNKPKSTEVEKVDENWTIDVFRISYNYGSKSAKKATKGKSKAVKLKSKKLTKTKVTTLKFSEQIWNSIQLGHHNTYDKKNHTFSLVKHNTVFSA